MKTQDIITSKKVMARVEALIKENKNGVVIDENKGQHVVGTGMWIIAEKLDKGRTWTLSGVDEGDELQATVRYSFVDDTIQFQIRPNIPQHPEWSAHPDLCKLPVLRKVARLVGIEN